MEQKEPENNTDEKKRESEILIAELRGLKVYINNEQCKSLYEKRYFGNLNNNILELEPIEALLLVERKRILVKSEDGNELSFKSLTEYFVNRIHDFWTKYLVYRDIRSRGYIVRPGYGDDIEFRVYERGAIVGESNAKYLIHPVIEGNPLKLTNLSRITKIAKSSRKKLVLTVVDRQGEVTYYQCKEVIL
ncbi:MAG: tRNA-intron lyase [Candidatus Helarchaeota archaeon]